VTTVKMTVSNDGDPISEPNREGYSMPFSPPAAIPVAPEWDFHRPGYGQPWRTIRLLPTDKGVAFELQFPAG